MTLEDAIRKAEPVLMTKANVVGVGSGERNGKPVIAVLVTRKMPMDGLRKDDVIPKSISGFPTDVVEVGIVSAQSELK